ncbi:MAG: aspartate carbamoyltransferase catalytic subunit [Candidatus Melainabacteria bacterium]|nr:aspartate carbamoyltransferase catalytic subunit [Candidatus Melainabacteria bacterium]
MLTNPPETSPSQEINQSLAEFCKTDGAKKFHRQRHLLDTGGLSQEEVQAILDTTKSAKHIFSKNKQPLNLLNDKIVATIFYENSTRTKSSFDLAARNLGARVIHLDVTTSSVTKGETIGDTAKTLVAMGVDALVQRHSSSGAAHQLQSVIAKPISIINAGDGWNAHPTQALLDLFTMEEICKNIEGKKVAIIGDIKHSRVARSNIRLLVPRGADVHLCAPPTLMPEGIARMGVTIHDQLSPAIDNADFIMSLRMQTERQQDGLITSLEDYRRLYRLDHNRLKTAKPAVRVLHPGPMNRGIELTSELADDLDISLIQQQVTNGIYTRMAVLLLLLFSEDGTR